MHIEEQLHTYRAYVVSVYDGDSIRCDITLGFGICLHNEPIRLAGINTPEIRGEEREQGLVARDRLRELILGKYIILRTKKDEKGKYGRLLGTIYLDSVDINAQLVSEGLAEVYIEGRKLRRPRP
jgi:micrococcal nuclease